MHTCWIQAYGDDTNAMKEEEDDQEEPEDPEEAEEVKQEENMMYIIDLESRCMHACMHEKIWPNPGSSG